MSVKLQVDIEKPRICKACGAHNSQRITHTRRRAGGDVWHYWRCSECGAHGVRIVTAE